MHCPIFLESKHKASYLRKGSKKTKEERHD
jgi:hypothetical protein